MKEYKELYAINDEELLEIIYEIKLSVNLKEIKQLVRQHAIDDDDILFGWCVYEYNKETIAKLLEVEVDAEADADAEQAN
jgi:DNA-binding transcriptional MerR regulator